MVLLDSLLRWLIPEPKDKKASHGGKDKIERRANVRKSFAPSFVVADAIAVMVADFDGPDGENFAERLVDSFGAFQGLVLLRRKESLRLAGPGGLGEKLAAAAEQGRAWLQGASLSATSATTSTAGACSPASSRPKAKTWPNR